MHANLEILILRLVTSYKICNILNAFTVSKSLSIMKFCTEGRQKTLLICTLFLDFDRKQHIGKTIVMLYFNNSDLNREDEKAYY